MASTERVLLDATVTDVGVGPFVYPACGQCYSKLIFVKLLDIQLHRCQNCGHSYSHGQEQFRYRLCLTVTDGTALASLTTFGGMLNSFFGVPATEFHNMLMSSVQEKCGAACENIMHVAVEQAFIGQRLLFGLKTVSSTTRRIHSKRTDGHSAISLRDICQGSSVSSSKSTGRHLPDFIAVQIMRPTESSFSTTVVDCLRHLESIIDERNLVSAAYTDRAALLRMLNFCPWSSDNKCSPFSRRHAIRSPAINRSCDIAIGSSADQSSLAFSCDDSLDAIFTPKRPGFSDSGSHAPDLAVCSPGLDVSTEGTEDKCTSYRKMGKSARCYLFSHKDEKENSQVKNSLKIQPTGNSEEILKEKRNNLAGLHKCQQENIDTVINNKFCKNLENTVDGESGVNKLKVKTADDESGVNKLKVKTVDGESGVNKLKVKTVDGQHDVNRHKMKTACHLSDVDRHQAKTVCGQSDVDRHKVKSICGQSDVDRHKVKTVCGQSGVDRHKVKTHCGQSDVDRHKVKTHCGQSDVDRHKMKRDCGQVDVDRHNKKTDCGQGDVDRHSGDVDRHNCDVDRHKRKRDCGQGAVDRHKVKRDCGQSDVDRHKVKRNCGQSNVDRHNKKTFYGQNDVDRHKVKTDCDESDEHRPKVKTDSGQHDVDRHKLKTVGGQHDIDRHNVKTDCCQSDVDRQKMKSICGQSDVNRSKVKINCGKGDVDRHKVKTDCGQGDVDRHKVKRDCSQSDVGRHKVKTDCGQADRHKVPTDFGQAVVDRNNKKTDCGQSDVDRHNKKTDCGHGGVDRHKVKTDCGQGDVGKHKLKTDCGQGDVDKHKVQTDCGQAVVDRNSKKTDCGQSDVDRHNKKTNCGQGEVGRHKLKTDCGHGDVDRHNVKTYCGQGDVDKHNMKRECGQGDVYRHKVKTDCGQGDVDRHIVKTDCGQSDVSRSKVKTDCGQGDVNRLDQICGSTNYKRKRGYFQEYYANQDAVNLENMESLSQDVHTTTTTCQTKHPCQKHTRSNCQLSRQYSPLPITEELASTSCPINPVNVTDNAAEMVRIPDGCIEIQLTEDSLVSSSQKVCFKDVLRIFHPEQSTVDGTPGKKSLYNLVSSFGEVYRAQRDSHETCGKENVSQSPKLVEVIPGEVMDFRSNRSKLIENGLSKIQEDNLSKLMEDCPSELMKDYPESEGLDLFQSPLKGNNQSKLKEGTASKLMEDYPESEGLDVFLSKLREDNQSKLKKGTASKLMEDCPSELMEDCPSKLMEDCPSELMEDCPSELMEDCSSELMEDCPSKLMKDCPSKLMEDCPSELMKDYPESEGLDVFLSNLREDNQSMLKEGTPSKVMEDNPSELMKDYPESEGLDVFQSPLRGDNPSMLRDGFSSTLLEDCPLNLREDHSSELMEDYPLKLVEDYPESEGLVPLRGDNPSKLMDGFSSTLMKDYPSNIKEAHSSELMVDYPSKLVEDYPESEGLDVFQSPLRGDNLSKLRDSFSSTVMEDCPLNLRKDYSSELVEDCPSKLVECPSKLVEDYPESEGLDAFISKLNSSIDYSNMQRQSITPETCTDCMNMKFDGTAAGNTYYSMVVNSLLHNCMSGSGIVSPDTSSTSARRLCPLILTDSGLIDKPRKQSVSQWCKNSQKQVASQSDKFLKKKGAFSNIKTLLKQATSQNDKSVNKYDALRNIKTLQKQATSQNYKNSETRSTCENIPPLRQQAFFGNIKTVKRQDELQNIKTVKRQDALQNIKTIKKPVGMSHSDKNSDKKALFQTLQTCQKSIETVKELKKHTLFQNMNNSWKHVEPQSLENNPKANMTTAVDNPWKITDSDVCNNSEKLTSSEIVGNQNKQTLFQSVINAKKGPQPFQNVRQTAEQTLSLRSVNSVKASDKCKIQMTQTVGCLEKQTLSENVTSAQKLAFPKSDHNQEKNTLPQCGKNVKKHIFLQGVRNFGERPVTRSVAAQKNTPSLHTVGNSEKHILPSNYTTSKQMLQKIKNSVAGDFSSEYTTKEIPHQNMKNSGKIILSANSANLKQQMTESINSSVRNVLSLQHTALQQQTSVQKCQDAERNTVCLNYTTPQRTLQNNLKNSKKTFTSNHATPRQQMFLKNIQFSGENICSASDTTSNTTPKFQVSQRNVINSKKSTSTQSCKNTKQGVLKLAENTPTADYDTQFIDFSSMSANVTLRRSKRKYHADKFDDTNKKLSTHIIDCENTRAGTLCNDQLIADKYVSAGSPTGKMSRLSHLDTWRESEDLCQIADSSFLVNSSFYERKCDRNIQKDSTNISDRNIQKDSTSMSGGNIQKASINVSDRNIQKDSANINNRSIQKDSIHVSDRNIQRDSTSMSDRNIQKDSTSMSDRNIQKDSTTMLDRNIQKDSTSMSDRNIQKDSTSMSDRNIQKDSTSMSDKNIQKDSIRMSVRNIQKDSINVSDRNIQKDSTSMSDRNIQKDSTSMSDRNIQKDSTRMSDRNIQKDSTRMSDRNIQKDSTRMSNRNIQKDSVNVSDFPVQSDVSDRRSTIHGGSTRDVSTTHPEILQQIRLYGCKQSSGSGEFPFSLMEKNKRICVFPEGYSQEYGLDHLLGPHDSECRLGDSFSDTGHQGCAKDKATCQEVACSGRSEAEITGVNNHVAEIMDVNDHVAEIHNCVPNILDVNDDVARITDISDHLTDMADINNHVTKSADIHDDVAEIMAMNDIIAESSLLNDVSGVRELDVRWRADGSIQELDVGGSRSQSESTTYRYNCEYPSPVFEKALYHNRDNDKPLNCTICPNRDNDKPLNCTICPNRDNDKPLNCTICPNRDNDRPLNCTICPNRDNGKPLNCTICPNRDNDKPFICTICPNRDNEKPLICDLGSMKASVDSSVCQKRMRFTEVAPVILTPLVNSHLAEDSCQVLSDSLSDLFSSQEEGSVFPATTSGNSELERETCGDVVQKTLLLSKSNSALVELDKSRSASTDNNCLWQRERCEDVTQEALLTNVYPSSGELKRSYSKNQFRNFSRGGQSAKRVRFSNKNQQHHFFAFDVISHLPVVHQDKASLKSSLKKGDIEWEPAGSQDLFSEPSQDLVSNNISLPVGPDSHCSFSEWNSSSELFSQTPEQPSKRTLLTQKVSSADNEETSIKTNTHNISHIGSIIVCAQPETLLTDRSFDLFTPSPLNRSKMNSVSLLSPAVCNYPVQVCITPDLFI